MARLGLLFVLVPLLELVLLIRMGAWIGFFPTALLVVGTGLLGAILIRREGLRAILSLQTELVRGRLPTAVLMRGAAILVGGAFLMTPGVLTDLAGFLLLLPPTRILITRWAQARLAGAVARGTVRVASWRFSSEGGATADHAGAGKGSPGDPAGSPVSLPKDGAPMEGQAGGRPPRPGEIIQE